MKKKIFVILVVVLFIVSSISLYFIFQYSSKQNIEKKQKNSVKDVEIIQDEFNSDIFGKFYQEMASVVSTMDLEEKVGQLFLIRYESNLVDSYIKKYHAGGFILFAKDFQNHTKSSIKKELESHNKISKFPLIYAVDEEGGYVTRVSRYTNFRESKFQSPKQYYEEGGFDLLESTEREKAKLLLSLGINLNLAPVADVSLNEEDFMYSRSFGQDALKTSDYIKHMVSYANSENISSCLKHFPGYGNNVDTHTGIAIDKREYSTFIENDYLPFIAGIEEKVPFILVSHNIMQEIDSTYPSSLSKKVITGELREKLGFTGIVITDDLDMDAVKSYADSGNSATLAINAGADMIITSDYVNMYQELLNNIKNGTIKESTIDTSVIRILSWKKTYGLF